MKREDGHQLSIRTAPIIWDGDVGGREGNPQTVYRMRISDDWTWFAGQEKFLENGNDFEITIFAFGLGDKISAESIGNKLFRRRFSADDSHEIKSRLINFFMGPEEKKFPPFMIRRARCVGVSFLNDWILLL